jgi:hypothetical protein
MGAAPPLPDAEYDSLSALALNTGVLIIGLNDSRLVAACARTAAVTIVNDWKDRGENDDHAVRYNDVTRHLGIMRQLPTVLYSRGSDLGCLERWQLHSFGMLVIDTWHLYDALADLLALGFPRADRVVVVDRDDKIDMHCVADNALSDVSFAVVRTGMLWVLNRVRIGTVKEGVA